MHNGTVETGDTLARALPGAIYTVQALTEHTATITGLDTVRVLDGHVIQCAYVNLGNLTKSNAVQFSFIPPGQSWNPLAVLDVPWLGYIPYSAIIVFTLCGSLQLTIVVTLATCTLCWCVVCGCSWYVLISIPHSILVHLQCAQRFSWAKHHVMFTSRWTWHDV